MHKFSFDLNDAHTWMSCAIENLYLLRDELYRDIFAMKQEQKFLGTGHLMSCCDAMGTALRELDRIRDEMNAAIEAEYTKGD